MNVYSTWKIISGQRTLSSEKFAKEMMAFWVLATISFALTVDALKLEQCASGLVQIQENLQDVDFVLSCTDIPNSEHLTWHMIPQGQPDTSDVYIGLCYPNSTCVSQINTISLSRPSADISHLSWKTATAIWDGAKLFCRTTNMPSEKCLLDKVYKAEGVNCSVQFNSTSASSWTVSGQCNVTKIRSSHGNYSCAWNQSNWTSNQQVLSKYITMAISESTTDENYMRATCAVSGHPMPITSANYSYSVAISPGSGPVSAKFTGSSVVRVPSTPTNNCPTDYVPESSFLNCACKCNDLGSPQGTMTWNGTASAQLVVHNVSRTQNNWNYTCTILWNPFTETQKSVFTLHVAYGPDSGTTFISGPDIFDTDGSHYLNLTCSTNDVNPTASFSWSGACSGEGQTCSVIPHTPTDVTATCHVTNAKNNRKSDTATKTVTLNYPPTDPPKISPSIINTVLYMNDTLTLNCDVNGGKPVVSRVNLTCDNHPRASSPNQSVQLVVTSLRADDHQTRCTCDAQWKNGLLYSKTGSVTLTVYSPPSTPSICSVNSTIFSYLEGDKPVLTCNSTYNGVPAASFSWSGHVTGDIATEGLGEVRLELRALTRQDNGRVVSCRASNDYTNKRGNVISNVTVHVYYKPDIYFTPLLDNECTFGIDPMTCMVREGQAVHVLCQADSNPMVDTVTWEGGTMGLRQLNIPVTDRHKHTGLFNCTAVTATSPPDRRLPLRGTRALTVFVTHLSNVTSFAANGRQDNLTVSENEEIRLKCQADGRPTSRMQIVIDGIQASLNQTAGGEWTLADRMSTLEYEIVEARCEDTGIYSCIANNSQHGQSHSSIVLHVRCHPRNLPDSDDFIPSVNFINQPVTLNFTIIAVPAPHSVKITFKSNNGTVTESDVTTDVMQGNCHTTGVTYKSVCVITVKEMERVREGFYVALLNNSVGTFGYTFEVKFNAVGAAKNTSIPGIVGGSLGAVVVIVAAAVVVLFIKRRRASSKAKQPSGKLSRKENPDMIVNSIYGTGNRDDDEADATMITNNVYQSSDTSGKDSGTQRSDYEVVEVTKRNSARPKHADGNSSTNSESDSNLYSSVDKSRKTRSAAKPTGTELTSSFQNHANLTTNGASTSSSQEPSSKAPKADTTTKHEKTEKPSKEKGKQNKEKKAVYGNMGLLSMRPIEATEYENFGFEKEGDTKNKSKKSSGSEVADTRNADNLTYTTIQFTDCQMQKACQPAPTRETTEYVSIDFTKRAPSDAETLLREMSTHD